MSTKSLQTNFVVVIPTLNNRQGLMNVLHDLQTEYAHAHVVIVNNGQKSLADLKDSSSMQIITIEQHRNTGFAKACNDGAKVAREHFNAQHLVFINDDVRFSTDWIERCIKTMISKKWFATSPLLKKLDGSLENIGYKVLPQGKVLEIRNTRSMNREPIDGITAAALVIKTTEFFELKGFDERFFAYLEDVDLFLRAKKLGKKFGTTTDAYVVHTGQQTSNTMKTFKAWLDLKNWYLLIYKHWGWSKVLKNFWPILVERLRNISGLIKTLF